MAEGTLRQPHRLAARLCKIFVARKALLHAWPQAQWTGVAQLYQLNARAGFGAAADACFLVRDGRMSERTDVCALPLTVRTSANGVSDLPPTRARHATHQAGTTLLARMVPRHGRIAGRTQRCRDPAPSSALFPVRHKTLRFRLLARGDIRFLQESRLTRGASRRGPTCALGR